VVARPPFASPEERLARVPDLVTQGALEEAARLVASVLDAAPGHPLAEYFAGLVAYERGAETESEDAYRRAILHAREGTLRAAAFHGLGLLLRRRGDLPAATEAFEKAVASEPTNAHHLRALAEILELRRRWEEAEEAIRRALRIAPEDPASWGVLADILTHKGRYEEALAALDAAESRLGPREERFAETVGLRARIAAVRGDLEGAREVYRRSLERDPLYPGYGMLAELHRVSGPEDPFLRWLLERKETLGEKAPADVRADLAYALGKCWEEAGDAEKAFAAYAEGARLARPPQAAEQVRQAAERVRLLQAGIDRAFFASVTERLARDSLPPECAFTPVFIVGLPRGGSTLLEQMLAAHPAIAAGGELPYGGRLARALLAAWYGRGSFPPDPETAARELADLARRYGRATADLRRGKAVLTDKALGNHEHAGLLALAFPRALFLHAYKKDALDQGWGIFRRNLGPGHDYSYDLEDIGRMRRLEESLARHWTEILPEGRYLPIAYEDLLAEPEGTIRRILDTLALPFDPACLEPEKVARPVATLSFAQVREPLHRERLGSAEPFRPWLEPLRRILEAPEAESVASP